MQKIRNWDSSLLHSSEYSGLNHCNLCRNFGSQPVDGVRAKCHAPRSLQCSRSSRTSDFFRIASAVIASLALLLEEKMLRRCPLQSLAWQSTTHVPAAAAATACYFSSCSTHVPLHSFSVRYMLQALVTLRDCPNRGSPVMHWCTDFTVNWDSHRSPWNGRQPETTKSSSPLFRQQQN